MGAALGREFASARRIYAEADEILGFALSKLSWEGPTRELTLTENAQPAILANSIAVLAALRECGDLDFDIVAGHSLGEWTALVAAGALEFADALRLVRLRGKLMQGAVPEGKGAMAAIIGLTAREVIDVCALAAEGEIVTPANFNGAGQVVISGHALAVDRASRLAMERGAKRAVRLGVSAPFHTELMVRAADRLAEALAPIVCSAPKVPIISNVDAMPHVLADELKELLVRQVTKPVLWEECTLSLAADGVMRAYEIGTTRVLSPLVKRVAPTISMQFIGEAHEIRAWGGGSKWQS